MRILHFNQHGTRVGGVEGYIAEASRALLAIGHESGLVYFEPDEPGDLISEGLGFHIVVVPENWETLIAEAIAQFQPDVAFVHAVYDPHIVGWLVERLPVLAYVHGPYLVCPGSTQFWRNRREVCTRRAGTACLIYAQVMRCCFGRNPQKHWIQLQKIYHFISIYRHIPILVGSRFMRDLLVQSEIPRDNISILAPIFLSSDTLSTLLEDSSRQILVSGRLVPEKGIDILIQAMLLIEESWRLVIAGDGPDRKRLEAMIDERGLNNRIEILGWQNESEMNALYNQSALVVVPSLWPEPFGRVGVESAQHGRPVVAFDVGGVRDWLENDGNGRLVPVTDAFALASSMKKILENQELRRKLGQNAFGMAMTRWNEKVQVEKLVRHLKDTVDSWSSTS